MNIKEQIEFVIKYNKKGLITLSIAMALFSVIIGVQKCKGPDKDYYRKQEVFNL